MRYRVIVPNWHSGVLTCETINGKEIVIHASTSMSWAVGKPLTEALFLYRYLGRNNGGTVVEPLGRKKKRIKIVRKKKRVIRINRRQK